MDIQELMDKDKSDKTLDKTDDILETEDYATFDMGSLDKVYGGLDGEVNSYLENDEYSDMSDSTEVDDNEDIDKFLAEEGVAVDDPVRMYLKDIGKIPLLDSERELYLAERIAQGDEAAKNELVEANLRLVVSIAK
ncbi:MAG: RNA polymerase sigma factor RpoD, partial [Clostridia bacterium]|nr:RNA polymerase sigma factor RpoD [Clostridia bacterium]